VLSLREIAEGKIHIQTEEEARLLNESKKELLPELTETTLPEEDLL
jgi:phosphosulfolactate synthase (CoM biosynthesis protein A)